MRHIIEHFGDEPFQAIDCTGIDNKKQGNKTPHTPKHKREKETSCPG